MSQRATSPIIEARGLVKRFGKVEALAGLDLVAERGQVVAVLGPNGAGKTTFVRSLATLVRADEGTLRVAGIDATRHPDKVRQVIGLAGQFAAVEEAMTGRENLQMVARLFGHGRRRAAAYAAAVLAQLGLTDAADRLVRTYSGGMRRRLDLGASLVGAPRLLLLDEPTTGLDPRSRNELWEAIRRLVAAGTDVLLTTQYLDEADQLAHRVVIVDKGRVIADGTPSELKSRAGRDVVEVRAHRADDLPVLAEALASLGVEAPRVHAGTSRVTVPVDGGRAVIAAAVRALDDLAIEVDDVGLRRPTLDEVFLTLTGSPIDGDADADDAFDQVDDSSDQVDDAFDDAFDDSFDDSFDDHATTGERAEPVAAR
jgi:ABC-2 type transport system ATP-binding protein